jgi:hypothetical protein
MIEHCVFCGARLGARQNRRHKKPVQVRAQCDKVWRETPMVWRELRALADSAPAEDSLAFCMPCVHWMSRGAARCRRGVRVLPMLDEFLLFTLFPFTARLPDARLLRRLAVTLAGTGGDLNLYRRLFPAHALAALAPYASAFDYTAAVHALCCAHWAHHGGSFLLGERGETKRMRHLGLHFLQPVFERAMAGHAQL